MPSIAVLERKCNGCGQCVAVCPFGGIEVVDGVAKMNAACRQCGLCKRSCAQGALITLSAKGPTVDKSKWTGILVIAQQSKGILHPVSMELIGKALDMAQGTAHAVHAVAVGSGARAAAEELCHYGVSKVYTYDYGALEGFTAQSHAACCEDAIKLMKPCVVLTGATAQGRSLAPRLATRLSTGLTADCTKLELRPNSDLVQTRPAFGGNIMAQIVTPDSRPQFATVRYRVMDAPPKNPQPSGEIITRPLPKELGSARFIAAAPVSLGTDIQSADVLIAAGRGLKRESDLALIQSLAQLLHGDWAVSRPLVEKGWADATRQIGMSGRTVKPRLIITCGISGAIQFTACMQHAQYIIAINSDKDAPIFSTAHLCLVGDMYEILPELIASLKEANAC